MILFLSVAVSEFPAFWESAETCGSNGLQSCLQNMLYMNIETHHWEHRKHGQRKRRQQFHTIFTLGFFSMFHSPVPVFKSGNIPLLGWKDKI